jgi:PAS domain S-box-containing protein/putative nucleotidyltransferase with HDIG domain
VRQAHKQTEEALQLTQLSMDIAADAIMWLRQDSFHTYVNDAACRLLGYSREEFMKLTASDVNPAHPREVWPAHWEELRQKKKLVFETALRRKDARMVPVEITANYIEFGDKAHNCAFVRDITERKQVEAQLHRAEKKYSTLVEQGNDGVIIIQDSLIKFANSKVAEITGIPLKDMIDQRCINLIFPEYRELIRDRHIKMMSGEEVPNSYEIEILTKAGNTVPIEINISSIEYDGRAAEMAILRDITERKKAEEESKQSPKKLLAAMDATIEAIALTVEMRDPYTAGHQRRVTELAVAIAKELGIPEAEIDGIRMAGIIHDIGKVYTPAEILNKPGKLSEIEFSMIKTHSQVGYEILKAIEFTRPVAQIVLQHHERLDGSGYPSGIKGEGVLPEAKILAVADVVEAMASHRPYRPALGIDQALEELSKNSGTLYDPKVVDACFKLFHEKSFKFEAI